MSVTASARAILQPQGEQDVRLKVVKNSSSEEAVPAEAEVSLLVRSSSGEGASTAVSPKKRAAKMQGLASGIEEYLSKHGVLTFMQGVLQGVIRDRPEDPYKYVADQFSSASVSKAATVEEMRHAARDALLQVAKSGELLEPWKPKTSLADKHNVTDTTKQILLYEFRRGYEVVKKVENNKADWKEVHNPVHFFSNDRFKRFLCLEVLAKSAEAHVKFCEWVESKLPDLHKTLEGAVSGMIIHPYPEQHELRSADTEWAWGCGMFIGLVFPGNKGFYVGQTVDLRPALHQFAEVVSTWPEKETYNSEFKLKMTVKRTHLPEYALKAEAERMRKEQRRKRE